MKTRVNVKIEGKVQGVNFRYYTRQEAQRLNVTGWVENASDGSVLGCFEGDQADVNALLNWCRTGPPSAVVTGIWAEDGKYSGEFLDFHIRRG